MRHVALILQVQVHAELCRRHIAELQAPAQAQPVLHALQPQAAQQLPGALLALVVRFSVRLWPAVMCAAGGSEGCCVSGPGLVSECHGVGM